MVGFPLCRSLEQILKVPYILSLTHVTENMKPKYCKGVLLYRSNFIYFKINKISNDPKFACNSEMAVVGP
jgi:hypothetical protein